MKRKKQLTTNTKTKAFVRSNVMRGTYKDLKRQAITLGMPYPEATGAQISDLMSYISHTNNTPDPSLIDGYDEWLLEQFDKIGIDKDDPIRHPQLRLGFIGEKDVEGNVIKRKRVPGIKKSLAKKPRERDSFNLLKGTKKSYTWELTDKGLTLERIIRRVQKKFPDANEKSIRLWHRACLRSKQKNGKN